MGSDRHRRQQIKGATVRMGQGEEAELLVAPVHEVERHGVRYVPGQVIARQHHAFAETRRAGGIVQDGYLLVAAPGIPDVVPRESLRICLLHLLVQPLRRRPCPHAISLIEAAEVAQRKGRAQPWEPLLVDALPRAVAHEEELRVGVIKNMLNIVRIEILEDRDEHRPVCNDRQVSDAPARRVFPHERHLLALPDAARRHEQVQAGHLLGHLPEGVTRRRPVVRHGRQLPILAEALLV